MTGFCLIYQRLGTILELTSVKLPGFARDLPFDLFEQTATSITFVLKSDENTFERYPFEFALYVKYTLHENQLVVNYRVYNLEFDSCRTKKRLYHLMPK